MSTLKSKLSKDFVPGEKMSLDSFRRIKITEELRKRYVREYPYLRHLRVDDNCDGYMFLDKMKLVGVVVVEQKENMERWIQAIEISKDYKGHSLGYQLLMYALLKLKAQYASVSKENEIMIHTCKKIGFKVFDSTEYMYFIVFSSVLNRALDKYHDIISDMVKLNKRLNDFGYGVVVNGKCVDYEGEEFANHYHYLSPREFERAKGGVCWDYVSYQSSIMKRMKVNYMNYYIELRNVPNSDTHTFTVIKLEDGMYLYTESSYQRIQGLYLSSNLEDITHFILHNMCKNHENKRVVLYIITGYKEYKNYGCTTLEFMDDMIKKKKVDEGVWSYSKKYNSLLKITDKLL